MLSIQNQSGTIRAGVEDRLSRVLGKLESDANSEVLVFEGDFLKGLLSPFSITKSRLDVAHARVGNFTKPVSYVQEGSSFEEIVRLLVESNQTIIPIKRGFEVLDVMHILDALDMVKPKLGEVKLKDFQGKESRVINENDSAGKAMHTLRNKGVHSLVVLNDKLLPIGVLSQFDIMKNLNRYSPSREVGQKSDEKAKLYTSKSKDMDSLAVFNFLEQKETIELNSTNTFADAINSMIEKNTLFILIKDRGTVIEARDILRYYLNSKK